MPSGSFVHAVCPARCCIGEGLLPERSVGMKKGQGTKTTVDHDRQGQAAQTVQIMHSS